MSDFADISTVFYQKQQTAGSIAVTLFWRMAPWLFSEWM